MDTKLEKGSVWGFMRGTFSSKKLMLTYDYTELGIGVWSGWRETRTVCSTTPFPKIHTFISVPYKPLFPKTTPPFL